jgi:AbrB family looped-hinge helix DNA binding protein
MRITIDAAGRLVVPKPLRAQLQIEGPTEVEIASHDGVIEIRPAAAETRIVRTSQGPVAQPVAELPPLTDDDVRSAIESTRR